jgi:hypothetical protein
MLRLSANRANRILVLAVCAATLIASKNADANLIGVSIDSDGGNQLVSLGESSPGSNIGRFRFTLGIDNCTFDGVTTACSLSGTYTETAESINVPGATGTFVFTQSFPGNGPSPLIAENTEPLGGNIRLIDVGDSSFMLNVMGDGGLNLVLNGGFFFGSTANPGTATCTGLESMTPCTIGQVGLVPGATYRAASLSSFSFSIPDAIFVPLPAALWMFLSGGFVLGGVARLRNRKLD